MDRTETEKMESVRKARGPYRRYNVDPSVPIPKTTLWRMKRSGIEPTGSEDSLHEVGTSSGKSTCESSYHTLGMRENATVVSELMQ